MLHQNDEEERLVRTLRLEEGILSSESVLIGHEYL